MSAINIGQIQADLQVNSGHLERGFAAARNAMRAVDVELRQLAQEFQIGTISSTDYAARVQVLTAQHQQLSIAMRQAYADCGALNRNMNLAGMTAAGASGRFSMLGMGLMQLGYIVDDIQYGFKGVVNNIGPLALALSKGNLALAAAAQIMAVAIYQLYTHWNDLMSSMGMGKILTEAEEMEKLAKATHRTAEETAKLNKYKKDQQEQQNIMERMNKEQRETQGATQEIYAEEGGPAMIEALAAIDRQNGGTGLTQEEKDKLDPEKVKRKQATASTKDPFSGANPFAASPEISDKAVQDEINRNKEKVTEALVQRSIDKARKLMSNAEVDPDKLRELIDRVEQQPASFSPGLAKKLRAQLPEERKKAKDLTEQGKATEEEMDRREKLEKQAEAEHERKKREDERIEREAEAHRNKVEADKKHAEMLAKQKKAENLNRARETLPGADDAAERMVASAAMKGQSMANVQREIAVALQNTGKFNARESVEAAGEMTKDAERKVKEKMAQEMLNPDQEKDSHQQKSQQFEASSLAAQVQAGVGGTEQKKQTSYLEQAVKHLANIAQMRGQDPLTLTVIK
jgi:hypothetical protein